MTNIRELIDKGSKIIETEGVEEFEAWFERLPEPDQQAIADWFSQVQEVVQAAHTFLRNGQVQFFLSLLYQIPACRCGFPLVESVNCPMCGEEYKLGERWQMILSPAGLTQINGPRGKTISCLYGN